jgi:bifunctional DNA-binding transcriptional regulator/antitoxin component of YhaV-PrlF toxin-antitoxin module
MSFIVEIQQDDSNEYFIEIPDEVLETVDWKEGDCLEWSLRGDSLVLSRIGEGVEFLEDSI